jgi:hypothetical protein
MKAKVNFVNKLLPKLEKIDRNKPFTSRSLLFIPREKKQYLTISR